jgi:hypothetical protein
MVERQLDHTDPTPNPSPKHQGGEKIQNQDHNNGSFLREKYLHRLVWCYPKVSALGF